VKICISAINYKFIDKNHAAETTSVKIEIKIKTKIEVKIIFKTEL